MIGVDVGGTKVAVGLLEGEELTATIEEPTQTAGPAALIDQLVRIIEQAARRARSVAGVGIGVPSVVQFDRGLVRSSVNVPLADLPLREVLGKRLETAVYVDNDATCAAIAEAYAQRPPVANLVVLTLGTGVGGGIVIGGRPYRGATGAAGELGHTIVAAPSQPQRADAFPKPGSLESLASGRALDRLARELAERGELDGEAATGRGLVAAASAGRPAALQAFRRYARFVGIGVANAINVFDPEVVALGGGVSAAGDLLLAEVREVARAYVLPGVGTRTEIRIARAGPRAGVVGAALLARLEGAGGRSASL